MTTCVAYVFVSTVTWPAARMLIAVEVNGVERVIVSVPCVVSGVAV